VKPPTAAISLDAAKKTYEKHPVEDDAAARFRHVVNACFGGRRLVVLVCGAGPEASIPVSQWEELAYQLHISVMRSAMGECQEA
jgi:hypothetical protein